MLTTIKIKLIYERLKFKREGMKIMANLSFIDSFRHILVSAILLETNKSVHL